MPLLTEARIRAARPKERAYKLFDERGLFHAHHPFGRAAVAIPVSAQWGREATDARRVPRCVLEARSRGARTRGSSSQTRLIRVLSGRRSATPRPTRSRLSLWNGSASTEQVGPPIPSRFSRRG